MSRFSDRRILVTGSTRGIGLAIARALLDEGATVGIHGRTENSVLQACSVLQSDRTIPLPCDLSGPESGSSLVKEFIRQAGALDALVNNAGSGKAAPFRAITTGRWRETLQLNTESALSASREAYNFMRKAAHGSIVNITSISAHGPGKWMGADYAASKAALVSLTKSLAFESARFGIRVNAVSPGFVNTDMTQVITDDMKDSLGIPMNRFANPAEIADVVLWLLSDNSAYITGQVMHVDGGLFMQQ